MLIVDVQIAVDDSSRLPSKDDYQQWAQKACIDRHKSSHVTIRIVDASESRQLNRDYRQKDKPTNVLSFPMEMPEDIQLSILGDIAICAEIVETEAQDQNKSLIAHWAHMVVHGMLHLQGYDHIDDVEAENMEALEVKILAELGFQNPYVT